MKKSKIIITGIILLSFIIAVYVYPLMPEKMASHWNARGEVDSYMSKFWGLFLMPIISVALFLLFVLIPKIDPLKANINKFRKYYDSFVLLIILFLFYIYLLTLFWNFDYRFNMTLMMMPALGILLYYAGVLVENAKRNWFVGIRTPWTLSNEKVWNKTHKIGAKLFKVAAIFAFLGIILPRYALSLVLIPVLFAAVYPIIYSYFEYKKQVKK